MKAIYEITGGYYKPSKIPILYDKLTGMPYDINLSIKNCNMRNGAEIILIQKLGGFSPNFLLHFMIIGSCNQKLKNHRKSIDK